jgi:hypothetical protein
MKEIAALLGRINAFCDRLNTGLAAVALILGFAVMTMAAVRGSEFAQMTIAQAALDAPYPDLPIARAY